MDKEGNMNETKCPIRPEDVLALLPAAICKRLTLSPGCWFWTGERRKQDGRAIFNKRYVYRILFEKLIGPIPGHCVLHHRTCNNKPCVNPWHTAPITQAEHMQEHGFGGDCNVGQAEKPYCPSGHPYDVFNTKISISKDGIRERSCRLCKKRQANVSYWKNLESNRRKAREYQRRKRGYSARD